MEWRVSRKSYVSNSSTMKTKILFTTVGAALALSLPASAVLIADAKFDDGTITGFGFDNNGSNPTYARTSETGVVTIGTTVASTGFSGGGFQLFDLANDPQFVAGSVTVAQLDLVRISFDHSVTTAAGINSLRLQPSTGSFGERIELTGGTGPGENSANNTGVFNLGNLDGSQKTTFVNSLNSGSATTFSIQFNFNSRGGNFESGDAYSVDNILIQTVPEPSAALLGVLGLGGLFLRRRR